MGACGGVHTERSANVETRMRGFMAVITDRKTAEEALRARAQQLQLAFEVASMGVADVVHDRLGCIIRTSSDKLRLIP